MAVYLRMLVYVLSSMLGGATFLSFDEDGQLLTVDMENLGIFLASMATVVGTWWAGRRAKAAGGSS